MTPKKRMLKTTASLARNLKPSGRLNVDDIEKAGKLRKTKPLSEQKNMKKFSKYMKQEMGTKGAMGLMSQGMSALAAKNLMKKARELKPSGRINMDDIKKIKQKTPMKKALGPVRSIRERAKQSRLVGGKSKMNRPKR